MADDQKASPGLNNVVVVVLACVISVVAASKVSSLLDVRPRHGSAPFEAPQTAALVAAPLWQDPFEAIQAHLRYMGQAGAKCLGAGKGEAAGATPGVVEASNGTPGQDAPPGAKDRQGLLGSQGGQAAAGADCSPLLLGSIDPDPVNGKILKKFVAVMVPGGSAEDAAETRRRRRYGVLSALRVAGYVPKQVETIGIARMPQGIVPAQCQADDESGCIPFEIFRRQADANEPITVQTKLDVVLLWLQEGALGKALLGGLDSIVSELPAALPMGKSLTVLGPSSSDSLRQLIDEMNARRMKEAGDLREEEIRAVAATVMGEHDLENGRLETVYNAARDNAAGNDAVGDETSAKPLAPPRGPCSTLSPDCQTITINDFAATADFSQDGQDMTRPLQKLESNGGHGLRHVTMFRRLGASDGAVARALAQELHLREVDLRPGRIVLISEWDTAYGQEFLQQLQKELRDIGSVASIERYSYFRGLDGISPTPAEGAGNSIDAVDGGPRDTKTSTLSSIINTGGPSGNTLNYVAEGASQADYLFRLGQDIRRHANTNPVNAIGIIGGDVYDKLLIVQALRQFFPHTLFFTADLDARLLGQDATAFTHNLVVASNFGLDLSNFGLDLQHQFDQGTPPFRDNYETAAYLAMLYSLQCSYGTSQAVLSWCGQLIQEQSDPLLVEIGATGETVPLGNKSYARQMAAPHSASFTLSRFLAALVASAGIVLAVLGVIWVSAKAAGKGLTTPLQPRRRTHFRIFSVSFWVTLVIFSCFLGWPEIEGWLTEQGAGEAILPSDGTSLWPVVGVQIATAMLACWFIVLAILVLNRSTMNLAEEFNLDSEHLVDRYLHRKQLTWSDFLPRPQVFPLNQTTRNRASRNVRFARGKEREIHILSYWRRKYVRRCAVRSRLGRSVVLTLLVLLAGFVAHLIYYPDPLVLRGARIWYFYVGSTMLVNLCVLMLVSLVFDATMNSLWLTHDVRFAKSHWPDKTIHQYEEMLNYQDPAVASYIDVEFISMRTQTILRLVYFPAFTLALMVFTQFAAARMVGWSAALIVIVGIAMVSLAACVIALRVEAELARSAALADLGASCSKRTGVEAASAQLAPVQNAAKAGEGARAGYNAATTGQLNLLMERVRDLRKGAFAFVLQQPIVKAFVLPVVAYCVPVVGDFLQR